MSPIVLGSVHSWWHCLGRARRCGIVRGSVSPEAGFESLKTRAISSLFSLPCTYSSKCEASAPAIKPPLCHNWSLTLGNCKSQ